MKLKNNSIFTKLSVVFRYFNLNVAAIISCMFMVEATQAAIRFDEVSSQLGIDITESTAQAGMAWIDYDNDGYLDLVAGSRLFHNVGSVLPGQSQFTEVSVVSTGSIIGD